MSAHHDLEQVARAMGISAYLAYTSVLCGSPTGYQRDLLARMSDVRTGDWVVETTTILMSVTGKLYRPALDAVGTLVRITQEKIVFDGDPDFVWDEAVEGKPHPLETCTYINTLDGREFRWTNASFVSIPNEYPHRTVGQSENGK